MMIGVAMERALLVLGRRMGESCFGVGKRRTAGLSSVGMLTGMLAAGCCCACISGLRTQPSRCNSVGCEVVLADLRVLHDRRGREGKRRGLVYTHGL